VCEVELFRRIPSRRSTVTPIVNSYNDSEFVQRYARARPRPPADLLTLLSRLQGPRAPQLVVDLGCGTGLSTVAWRGRARRAIGIDRNPNMMALARPGGGVEFREGKADHTGIPSASADLVTCSQSFHWMAPSSTIREIARILRPGGVFAAYDYAVPPLILPELDPELRRLFRWTGLPEIPVEKARHLARLARSRRFRWTRRVYLHSVEQGNVQRLFDFALSIGHVAALVHGVDDKNPHWVRFRKAAERRLGSRSWPWWWTYDVALALK